MHKKVKLMAITLSALALLGASCSQKTPVSTNASSTSETKVAISDSCGNPYYPFKPGLAIAYGVTPASGAPGSSDYTMKIVSVAGTVAQIRVELKGGATADMEADCASGSVALNGSEGLGAAMGGMKFKTTVISSTGSSMPADVKAGSVWTHSEKIKMEVTGGTGAVAGSTITLTTDEESKAIGEEKVTVPAGTYTAMKIEITRKTTSEFAMASGATLGKLPTETIKSTEWWVKGVGMVKEVTVTKDGTSTTEAKSVSGN